MLTATLTDPGVVPPDGVAVSQAALEAEVNVTADPLEVIDTLFAAGAAAPETASKVSETGDAASAAEVTTGAGPGRNAVTAPVVSSPFKPRAWIATLVVTFTDAPEGADPNNSCTVRMYWPPLGILTLTLPNEAPALETSSN